MPSFSVRKTGFLALYQGTVQSGWHRGTGSWLTGGQEETDPALILPHKMQFPLLD